MIVGMGQIGKMAGAAGEGERGDSALARGMRAIGICSIANTPAQVRADKPVKGAQVGCAEKGGGEGHLCGPRCGKALGQSLALFVSEFPLLAERVAAHAVGMQGALVDFALAHFAGRAAAAIEALGADSFENAHAASPVARAWATTGDSADASSAPPVTRSASSANSGGQGLSLSCDILPRETPIAAASWLAFIASGRWK